MAKHTGDNDPLEIEELRRIAGVDGVLPIERRANG
jgi:hypothetical protein